MLISQPVGGSGAPNLTKDVLRVRELFAVARYQPLLTGGFDSRDWARMSLQPGPLGIIQDPFSSQLEEVIRCFQRELVGVKFPDGRIDTDGDTIHTLVAEARKAVCLVDRVCRQYSDPEVTMAIMGQGFPSVVKGSIEKPELVSWSTIAALRMLGYCCGLEQMTITEGIRSYELMASYFLRKITSGTSGVRGEGYRHALKILAEHNGGNPYPKGDVPQEHIKAVADRMRQRCEETKTRVSLHVVSEDEYRRLNVVDLGYNSNPTLKDASKARLFARMLDSFHVNNPLAKHRFIRTYHPPHYLNPVLNSPYAREIKKEEAWHIELVVSEIPKTIA